MASNHEHLKDKAEVVEQIREMLPFMRAQKSKQLDKIACSGRLFNTGETGCSCNFLYYRASPPVPRPLIVVLHGGGFALGDAREDDLMCAYVNEAFNVNVVSIDYRLAPEHPFPAALEDVQCVLSYLARRTHELGIDARKIILLGFSAGANLALATCLALREEQEAGTPDYPAALILHYPFLDAHIEPEPHNNPAGVSYELMVAFNEFYAAGANTRDPLISPLYATDRQLEQLPRVNAYSIVDDPLAPSCSTFCKRLSMLGVPVQERMIHGQYHGFIEDAVNLPSYLATTPRDVILARPHDFCQKGWGILIKSLSECLDEGVPSTTPPQKGLDELEKIYASGA